MLVLSRKKGERIMIGDNVEVTIIEVRGDRVKIGFSAPSEVAIHREEVFARIESETWHETNDSLSGRRLVAGGRG